MRHGLKNKRLGKKTTARMSMLMAQASALLVNNKIKLTLVRAKQVRSIAERLIGIAKYNTLASRRRIAQRLRSDRSLVKKVMELGTRYEGRAGGFTRIIRIGSRLGDGASMAILELV